jgi:hypothetical protein
VTDISLANSKSAFSTQAKFRLSAVRAFVSAAAIWNAAIVGIALIWALTVDSDVGNRLAGSQDCLNNILDLATLPHRPAQRQTRAGSLRHAFEVGHYP